MTVYLAARMRSRSEPSVPRRRRRWLPAAVAALAFLIALSTVVVIAVLANFVPIRANASTPYMVGGEVTRLGSFVPPSGGPPFAGFDVHHRNGEPFEYGFTLYNNSPFDVTVEQVGGPGGSTLRQVRVLMAREDAFAESGTVATVPFSPFSIASRQAKFIVVQFRFTDCNAPSLSTSATVFAEPVQYRFLGVSRRELLPLPFDLRCSEARAAGRARDRR
jgi:hypothetical protein